MTDQPEPGEVRQLLVHPAVWPRLELWLEAHGITLACAGQLGEDDLPTWVMTLTRPTP